MWVSCLALAGLLASCSGNAGSPIQDNLDADYVSENPPSYDSSELPAGLPDPLAEAAADGEHAVSFTPGAACLLGAGITFPSVLNYGWMGGLVTEGAAPDWVKLTHNAGAATPWIGYAYKEMVLGRLQNLKITGAGKGLSIYVYNFRTATWNYFGLHDLSLGPVNLPLAIEYAPNGMTYVILMEPGIGGSRIDKIQASVF
jgi:hypothetical protein